MARLPFKLKNQSAAPRIYNGKKYTFWFFTESKRKAEEAKKELSPDLWNVRVAKVSRGYNVYTRHK